MRRVMSAVTGLLLTTGSIAMAQRSDTALRPRQRAARIAAEGRAGRNGQPPISPQQQALVRQVRQAFAGVVKKQLSLNDEQMRRTLQVDDRYQKQRNQIGREEREAREGLKIALEDTVNAADQAKVDRYMTTLVQTQRKRADLLEAEQKDFAEFLTPVQRAKFFALRDQLQRRVAQMRQEGRRGGPPPQP